MAYQLFSVVILIVSPFVSSNRYITILSNFQNNNDVTFFKSTFPWIVENIGMDINFQFVFKDSKEKFKSGRRQCILLQLSQNSYLQAEYLRCEANGGTECIKTLPLNNNLFNYCIITKARYFARRAESEFKRLKIDTTPTITLPRRQIYKNVAPEELLQKICALFSERTKPGGCLHPSPLPNNSNASSTAKPNETESTSTDHSETSTTSSTDSEKKESEDNLKVDKDKNPENLNTTDAEKKESEDTLKENEDKSQNLLNASKENKPDPKNVKEPNKNQKLQTTSSNQNQVSKVNKREVIYEYGYKFELDNPEQLDEYKELEQETGFESNY